MTSERTLVLIKPDGVQKKLSGRIIDRFESAGLKIIGMKMLTASEEKAKEHYPLEESWAKKLYDRTKETYEKSGKPFQYNNHMEYGELIISWLCNFITEGPIIAMTLEGPHAVELVRKMIGHTEPRQSAPGTIRGDFASTESYKIADSENRVIRNLVHASDSVENALREISIWFSPEELTSN